MIDGCAQGPGVRATDVQAIAEKDVLTWRDIACVEISIPFAPAYSLTPDEIRDLFDLRPQSFTLTGSNPMTIRVIFSRPEWVHDIEVLGIKVQPAACDFPWTDIQGTYSFLGAPPPSLDPTREVDSSQGKPKRKIAGFELVFQGVEISNGTVETTANLQGVVVRTFGQKEVWSPPSQPTYVVIQDKVCDREVSSIQAFRSDGMGGFESYVMTRDEIRALLDWEKRTTVPPRFGAGSASWHSGDVLLVNFEATLQVNSAQVEAEQDRDLTSIIAAEGPFSLLTAITGDWEGVAADPNVPNIIAEGQAHMPFCAKLAGFAYEFGGIDADFPDLAAITIKKFTHTDPCCTSPAPPG